MDPMSLVLIFVLFEAATGGYLSATVGGAASAAWSATWREVAGSAKSSYANRANRLGQSKTGRWRLAAEKRVWNGGQRVQAGVAGLARGGGRAVAAGVKAAPDGARHGHDVRRQMLGRGKAGVMGLRDKIRGYYERRDERDLDRYFAGGGRGTSGTGAPPPDLIRPSGRPANTNPTKVEERKPAEPEEGAKPFIPPAWLDQAGSPATDAGEKEEQVSNDLSGCAEDRGVKPYVEGWDGESGGLERYVSELTVIRDRIAAAVEANRRHDPDGAADVVGALSAAVDAVVNAGEQVDTHAAVLHGKWDTTIDHLNSTGAESAQELVGAH